MPPIRVLCPSRADQPSRKSSKNDLKAKSVSHANYLDINPLTQMGSIRGYLIDQLLAQHQLDVMPQPRYHGINYQEMGIYKVSNMNGPDKGQLLIPGMSLREGERNYGLGARHRFHHRCLAPGPASLEYDVNIKTPHPIEAKNCHFLAISVVLHLLEILLLVVRSCKATPHLHGNSHQKHHNGSRCSYSRLASTSRPSPQSSKQPSSQINLS